MKPHRIALALSLTLGLPPALLAQATPTSPQPGATAAATSEEVVTLETFTVNTERDNGYIAVDSLAGGRMNTPVRVTPTTVSSLTKGFINDLSLTNVQDALQWASNTLPTNFRGGMSGGSGGDVFNFWSVSIRGDSHVQGGNPPTKNYFPTFVLIDTYNIERIEIDAGPNSILFGIGDIGGALTSYTKNALFNNDFTTVGMRVTDNSGYRFTADINRAVTDNLALRVNALLANEKGWQDGDFNKKKGIDLATTYRISDSSQVRVELEGWKQEKAIFASTIRDGLSLWNGTTNAATWHAPIANINANPLTTSGAPGVHTMDAWGGPNDYYVWTPGVGLLNWAGGARSMGTGDVGDVAFLHRDSYKFGANNLTIPALPSKDFLVAPSDATLKQDAFSATGSFEQRINPNSEFQIAGYYYVDKAPAKNFEGAGGGLGYGVAVDLNQQLPNGQTNPNYGKRYSDFFLDEQLQDHKVNEIRGQYSYHFDTEVYNIPLKQNFSVSVGHQDTKLITRQHQATVLENYDANNWTRNMIWGRVYWDNPTAGLHVPKSTNGVTTAYNALPFNWFDWDIDQKIDYFGAFSQTRMWDDRLNVSLGLRRDKYDNTKTDVRGTNNSAASDAGNTYSAGFVGYITPWLGVVGNISDNFQPAAGGQAPSLYGEIFGPSFGKGRNIGLRVSTQDGKYWASASYYNDRASDIIGATDPGFQGIWNDYFDAGGTNTDIGPAGNVTGSPGNLDAQMQFNDTYDVKYSGVEFEVTANPTKNFRIQAHFSVPKGTKENEGPNYRRYWDEHLATWQAAAAGSSPESTKLASTLANAKKIIDSFASPTTTGKLAKQIYNVFGAYSFTEGSLKGFEAGLGVSGLGKQYGNPWEIVNGQRTLSPAYNTWSLLLAYSKEIQAMDRNVRAKVQLNVDNLFDNDKLIYLTYYTSGGQLQGADFRYLTPRQISLTATFTF